MFVNCSNFAIQGGSMGMTNDSKSEENDSDYRTIRVGDIDVRHCVREDDVVEYRVVQKRRGGVCRVQRVWRGRRTTYHARIVGLGIPDIFTVMAYTGAEIAQWKSEVEESHQQRHPFLFQLFGIIDSYPMYYLIFHGELIPVDEAIPKFPTHLTRLYSLYVLGMQLESFRTYCNDNGCLGWFNQPSSQWFRLSTGSLSVEPGDQLPWYKELRWQTPDRLGSCQALIPSRCMSDSDIMRIIQVGDLFKMIPDRSGFDYMPDLPLLHEHIYLGALYSFDTPGPLTAPRLIQKILCFPTATEISQERPSWKLQEANFNLDELQKVNCTRIALRQLHQIELPPWQEHHSIDWYLRLEDDEVITTGWLAQANHTFVASPFSRGLSADNLALTTHVMFTVDIYDLKRDSDPRRTFMAHAPANDLFLFLANPKAEIQNGILSVALLRPENAFYWSFEPDGSIPLTPEELKELPLPEVIVRTFVGTQTWTKEDYQLMSQFCVAKNIDPESTNLAVQLGYPLAVMYDDHSSFIKHFAQNCVLM